MHADFLKIGLIVALLVASPSTGSAQQALDYQSISEEVRVFLGPLRGDYIVPGAQVSEQVDEAMGGPGEIRDEAGGRQLLTGFRPHSAGERGAVLLDAHQHVIAVGLINFHCKNGTGPSCDEHPSLTIFAPYALFDRSLAEPLVRWAHSLRNNYSMESRLTGQPLPFGSVEFEFRSTGDVQ